jgi:hypothetical protein
VLVVLLLIGTVWLIAMGAAMILCVAARRIDEDVAAGRVRVPPAARRRILRPVA